MHARWGEMHQMGPGCTPARVSSALESEDTARMASNNFASPILIQEQMNPLLESLEGCETSGPGRRRAAGGQTAWLRFWTPGGQGGEP